MLDFHELRELAADVRIFVDVAEDKAEALRAVIAAYDVVLAIFPTREGMLRVRNLDVALKFYQDALGLKEVRRIENDKGRFTLVFLCSADDLDALNNQPKTRGAPLVELTYNWDEETYGEDRFFGHLAYEVDDIYATCEKLQKAGVTINRPPRDGNMPSSPARTTACWSWSAPAPSTIPRPRSNMPSGLQPCARISPTSSRS